MYEYWIADPARLSVIVTGTEPVNVLPPSGAITGAGTPGWLLTVTVTGLALAVRPLESVAVAVSVYVPTVVALHVTL